MIFIYTLSTHDGEVLHSRKRLEQFSLLIRISTTLHPEIESNTSLPMVRRNRKLYVDPTGEDREAGPIILGGRGENASVDSLMQVKHQSRHEGSGHATSKCGKTASDVN